METVYPRHLMIVLLGSTIDSVKAQPFCNADGSYTINGLPAVVSPIQRKCSDCKMKPRIGVLTSGGDCPGLNAVLRGVVLAAEKLGREVVVFVTDSKDFFLRAIMSFWIAKALMESWLWAARSSARRIAAILLPKSALAIGPLCLRTSSQAPRRSWMSFE